MLQDPLVFDASILFNVGHRGELRDLLRRLRTSYILLVPAVVVEEVSAEPSFDYRAFFSEYFEIRAGNAPPDFLSKLAFISARLNAGEIEVMTLCATVSGTAVIDEKAGRAVATQLGLPVTGTLGLLQYAVV
jgi:predicted nucleic acid-binding protein